MKRWLALAGWLTLMVVSITGLHRLGRWLPPDLILDPRGPLEPALASALRLVGLAVSYWLAGSTILYLIGRAARLPSAVRAIGWATITPVRRLVDRIAVGALVATISLPTAAGAMTDTGYVPVPAGDPVDIDPVATENAETPDQIEVQLPRAEIGPAMLFLPVQPAASIETDRGEITNTLGPIEVVVRPGDHMWRLAEQRLALVRGRAVSDSEIAPYWLKVVGTNLSKIRSGDPDLIFPGEVLVLPAIEA